MQINQIDHISLQIENLELKNQIIALQHEKLIGIRADLLAKQQEADKLSLDGTGAPVKE